MSSSSIFLSFEVSEQDEIFLNGYLTFTLTTTNIHLVKKTGLNEYIFLIQVNQNKPNIFIQIY